MAYYIPQEVWGEIMSYFVKSIENELNDISLNALYKLHNTYSEKIIYSPLSTKISMKERRITLMKPIIRFHHKNRNLHIEIYNFKKNLMIEKNKQKCFNCSSYRVGNFIKYKNEVGMVDKVYKSSIHCIFYSFQYSRYIKKIIRENITILN